MSITFLLVFLLIPSCALAVAWWFWFSPAWDQQPAPRWRRTFLLGGLISASTATALDRLYLNHTVSAMISRNISESIVWNLLGDLIAISFLVVLMSLVLGKGQARLPMGAWLFAFLGVNYITFAAYFTY